jgi:hypothetical protein
MLPRYRCSLLAEETDWQRRSTGPRDAFSVGAGLRKLTAKITTGATATACPFESAFSRVWPR